MDADIMTLIANLRYAARNKQGAVIGGGVFGPETLGKLAETLERSEKALNAAHIALAGFPENRCAVDAAKLVRDALGED